MGQLGSKKAQRTRLTLNKFQHREPTTKSCMKPDHRSCLIPLYHYYDVLYTLLHSTTILYTTILQGPPLVPK